MTMVTTNLASTVPSDTTGDILTSHKVLVGILFLVVVLVILVEGAGESHEWAVAIGLLLMGPLLMEGMNHASTFASWAKNNPTQKGLQ